MKTKKEKFVPQVCGECSQTTDYEVALDKGSAYIVIAIANAVRLKNKNAVHLRNEMLCKKEDFSSYREMVGAGKMTSTMIDNVLRPKYHDLVAQVDDGGQGFYLFTPKGARFLKGESIQRIAIVDKKTHSKKFYWHKEEERTTIKDLLKRDIPFLEGEYAKFEQAEMFRNL